jgi:hypothetical protein
MAVPQGGRCHGLVSILYQCRQCLLYSVLYQTRTAFSEAGAFRQSKRQSPPRAQTRGKESYSIQPDTTDNTTSIILLPLCIPLKRPVCSSSRTNTYASRRTAVLDFPSFSTATFGSRHER